MTEASSTRRIGEALGKIFRRIIPTRSEEGTERLPDSKQRNLLRLQDSFRPKWANEKLEWLRLLDSKVFLIDNSELGRIEALNRDLVIIKKVSIRTKRYSVTWEMLRKNEKDSSRLFLDLTSDEVVQFETNRVPNPADFATLG